MIASMSEVLTILGVSADPDNATLANINLAHRGIERLVKNHLGYEPEQKSHTEYLPSGLNQSSFSDATLRYEKIGNQAVGWSSDSQESLRLQLRHLPVRSITELRQDSSAFGGSSPDSFGDGTILVAGRDFFPDIDEEGICRNGMLVRINGAWSSSPRSIKVTYVAGYSPEELAGGDSAEIDASDLKLAVLEAVREWQIASGSGGQQVSSESVGDYSVSYVAPTAAAAAIGLSENVKSKLSPYVSLARLIG